MKIKEANFSVFDMSDAERVKFKKPTEEDLEKFTNGIKSFLKNLQDQGVTEIGSLNISFFDFNGAEDLEELL